MSLTKAPASRHLQGLCVTILLLGALPQILHGQLASPLFKNPQVPLVVHTVEGSKIYLKTVVVSTPEDLSQGLMHVRYLPANVTMLFLYERPRIASMWMKNTHIPLDMWWVDVNMTIRHIVHRTTPHSLESVAYDKPVRAVIEINAGLSRLLGISVGSKIEFDTP
ncbi:MAG: DUF192 domain-containing protein [Gammaproteobacteria bacterium]|nr:DUF192 domain-containing protein [Gammaproteobacteria bacterium]